MTSSAAPGASSLFRLAQLYGVQTAHYADRRRVDAGPEAVMSVLRALGADVGSPADVPRAISARLDAMEARAVEPVHVLWDGRRGALQVNHQGRRIACSLRLESGETREIPASSGREVSLPALPFGYHHLTVAAAGDTHDCLIISAPSRAFGQPRGARTWGAFLPLWAVRHQGDWGAGDFTGLGRLAAFTRRLGGSVVATTPVMAAFLDEPFNPSPYAPVSRLFWNEFYLDIERVPELRTCPEARALIASPAFQRDIASLRSSSLVDYRGVMSLKRRALSLLAAALSGARLEAFQRFVRDRPELTDYARFRAAAELYRTPWSEWPEPGRSGCLDGLALALETVHYHEYAQWIVEEQLGSLARDGAQAGVSLFLDLPVGASRDSYDIWRNSALFAHGASVGAPPDAHFVQGQDWGFPPWHPDGIRSDRYALFITVIRNLLRFAGALRIDHVMGLHRLYWVPRGTSPDRGVYVHYRPEEMYAILCLESHRNRALIAGEDLGIVPPAVKASLARHNVYGMHVMQFEVPEDTPRVGRPRERAVAALNTHDTPPFAAWLDGADIDDATRLGFLDQSAATSARARRCRQRKSLSRCLQDRNLAPASPAPRDLLRGSLRHLAASRAAMMVVNMEDLWLETGRQNIPGTNDEQHHNWRRKSARSLEEIETDREISSTLQEVNSERAGERTR